MSKTNDPDRANARRRFTRWLAAAVVFSLVCYAGSVRAQFDRLVTSARTVALGGAFTGVADDPSATLENPAGLALLQKTSFLSTYENPYGMHGLDNGFAAIGIPVRVGVLGVSGYSLSGRGLLTQNLATLAFARHLVATTQDASLSVGASLDLARVSGADAGCTYARNVYTGGLGVLLRPFPVIGIGYSIRNLNEDSFDVPGEDPAPRLGQRQTWGLSYKWNGSVTLAAEWSQSAAGQWQSCAGTEIVVHPNLHIRGGVGEESKAAGFGWLWRGLHVDAALESHTRLGATYVFSVSFMPEARNPYAR